MIFHHGAKEIVINPLHARIPSNCFRQNTWVNLMIDVWAFAEHCFKGVNIRSLDFIKIGGQCKIRKIFTCAQPLLDDELHENIDLQQSLSKLRDTELRMHSVFDYVPKQLDFAN